MKRKYLYIAAGAGGVLLLVYWIAQSFGKTSASGAPPAVAGTVTSGGQSVVINDNVLSPGFGLPITS
jgi:hypothetical protein